MARAWPRVPACWPRRRCFAVLFGLAVSVDYPRAAGGFKGDEATYYSLTHSIARDFDFTFQRQDLVRVWEEFSGPEGIFLKRGSRIAFARTSAFPFIRMVRTADPARYRLYYAKSYIYPLFAAPFVRVFGTNGFLVFHALLLALSFALATRFLEARGARTVMAASFAAVFLFASVVPVYFFWLMPELFNFSSCSAPISSGPTSSSRRRRSLGAGSNAFCARPDRTMRRPSCWVLRRSPSRHT